MNTRPPVLHYDRVDTSLISARFSYDELHRADLQIPFKDHAGKDVLCVIGQNPSSANRHIADDTIGYLEKLVYMTQTNYSKIVMLNLYSRVDTQKSFKESVLDPQCDDIFKEAVKANTDFLIVYGKLTNAMPYHFRDRARIIRPLLRGKRVMKLDINTIYAPHPGNPKIFYRKFDVGFAEYDFEDL